MHIALTPELENIIQKKVQSGFYSNASEVVRDAIRRLHERDSYAALRGELNKGFAQLDAGKSLPLDMEKAKSNARQNAKSGKKVKDIVTPAA
jgi:antitoxin ParD1/3/4